MRNKILSLTSLAIVVGGLMGVMVFNACSSKTGVVPSPVDAASLPDSCSHNISYAKQIAPILTKSCNIAGCHKAGMYNFTTYAKLSGFTNNDNQIDWQHELLYRLTLDPSNSKFMPYGSSLTDCEKAKLISWLNAGGPQN